MDKSLQIHIVSTTDPKKAWKLLEERFSFLSVTQIVRLTCTFYAGMMKDDDDLMEHLTMIAILAQQLCE